MKKFNSKTNIYKFYNVNILEDNQFDDYLEVLGELITNGKNSEIVYHMDTVNEEVIRKSLKLYIEDYKTIQINRFIEFKKEEFEANFNDKMILLKEAISNIV